MKSPCCNADFIVRGRSKNKGELLLTCPKCESKWQCREGKYSHPYQVRKRKSEELSKSIHVSGRMNKNVYESLVRNYGTFQKFLDFYKAGVVQ